MSPVGRRWTAIVWSVAITMSMAMVGTSTAGALPQAETTAVRAQAGDQEAAERTLADLDEVSSMERELARQMVDRINEERAVRGLDLVAMIEDGEVAVLSAQRQRDRRDVGHFVGSVGAAWIEEGLNKPKLGRPVASAGEISVAAFDTSGSVRGWMLSDAHRVVLLAEFADQISVGVACTDDGVLYASARLYVSSQRRMPMLWGDTWEPRTPMVTPEKPVDDLGCDGPTFDGPVGRAEPPSDDLIEDSVERLYRAGLGRAPDARGHSFWVEARKAGMTPRRTAEFFLSLPEGQRIYAGISDDQFVNRVYTNVLGRSPDEPGRIFWQSRLDAGEMDRIEVLLHFADSDENVERTGTRI